MFSHPHFSPACCEEPALHSIARAWSARSTEPAAEGEAQSVDATAPGAARRRLADLDPHLHCSVIGTCCSSHELKKLLARFIDVRDMDELTLHHEAVRLAALGGEPARQMGKALDRRYESTLQRYARARDEASLQALWKESLKAGDIPGAYWAVLTHRRATEPLRQQAFGDVHMLSHLVGAANRADIRRLVSLEQENHGLRDRLDRAQERHTELVQERDHALQSLQEARVEIERAPHAQGQHEAKDLIQQKLQDQVQALEDARERGQAMEAQAQAARRESLRLAEELQQQRLHAEMLARELAATERHVRFMPDAASRQSPVEQRLQGQRLLYVGGRPSSTPAIRALVEASGGDFRRHDGGLEDRKGALAAALAWADLVVFPVDCIDHDSALALKRDCKRQGRPFLPLRSASVTSLIAALAHEEPPPEMDDAPALRCLRHA